MKEITLHHDGHGLNENIRVRAVDDVGPGGAHHEYEFVAIDTGKELGYIQFQKGPRNVEGSVTGVLTGCVLAMLIDVAQDFQAGEFPSDENAQALEHMRAALDYYKRRADERASRGVLGYNRV